MYHNQFELFRCPFVGTYHVHEVIAWLVQRQSIFVSDFKRNNLLRVICQHENDLPLFAFAHLCRSYPCPGSIAMTAFLHASRFCASFGSSRCCLKSLRTLSIHLSLGLPRGLFPPTFNVVTSILVFLPFVSSLLITWPYHERRFWVTYVVIGLTIASLLNIFFLI